MLKNEEYQFAERMTMSDTEKVKTEPRILKGIVVSTKMDKTVTVEVSRKKRHPRYEKIIKRNKTYFVHDEKGELNVGDYVMLRETRPLSKCKRFTLHEVIERAK